jgi:hypothetical protein
MSSLIDATAALITHNNWGTNLQRIVEIITPIGWVHGFVNYPKVMKKWRQHGLPPYELGHNGNLTVAYILECKEMFGRLNNRNYPHLTPFVNSNLFVDHCLQANYCVYETICHILGGQADGVEVSYHAVSVKLIRSIFGGEFLPSIYFTYLVGWQSSLLGFALIQRYVWVLMHTIR